MQGCGLSRIYNAEMAKAQALTEASVGNKRVALLTNLAHKANNSVATSLTRDSDQLKRISTAQFEYESDSDSVALLQQIIP